MEQVCFNPLIKVIEALDFSNLKPKVEAKYSKRKRRKPLPWLAMIIFLILMYVFTIRSQRQLSRDLNSRFTFLLQYFSITKAPHHSSFTRFRKRLGLSLFYEAFSCLVKQLNKLNVIRARKIAIDSTDFNSYSNPKKKTDSESAIGFCATKEKFFDGYKQHSIIDAETELPVAIVVKPGNIFDSDAFESLFSLVLKFRLFIEKLIADCAYDSTGIREILYAYLIKPVIAINGRGHYSSSKPKDKDYSKRVSIERFHSEQKQFHRLDDLKYRGLENAYQHSLLSSIAVLFVAFGSFTLGLKSLHSVVEFTTAITFLL